MENCVPARDCHLHPCIIAPTRKQQFACLSQEQLHLQLQLHWPEPICPPVQTSGAAANAYREE